MSFGEGLRQGRGQIAFLIGLLIACGTVVVLEQQNYVPVSDVAPASTLLAPPTQQSREAWRYFERNYDARTGLVNANDRAGWTTVGSTGHALRAALAAHRLGIISGKELYTRLSAPLKTISALPLQSGGARISTASGQIVAGAEDSVAPFVSALELIAWSYPAEAPLATKELQRWRGMSGASAASGPSDAERNASSLVQAALARRGDD